MSVSLKNQLAEDFLKDLDDEEEEDQEDDLEEQVDASGPVESHPLLAQQPEDDADSSRWEIPDAVQIYLQARRKPRELLTVLLENQQFLDFLSLLQNAIEAHQKGATHLDAPSSVNHDQVVETLNKCNAALLEVDQEILSLYRYIKDIYNKRFPELDAIVVPPLDYIEVVKRLQNQLDVSVISSLGTVLPNSLVMATNVAASVTIGKLLTFTELKRVLDAIEEVDRLVQCRKTILHYIEIHLSQLAPNLTALAGSSLAAGLVTHAGSLKALADMPAQNILLIGGSAYSRAQTAFSSGSGSNMLPAAAKKAGRGYGIIWHSDLVQSAPPQLRVRALRLMSGKCALAARTDVYHPTRSDAIGRRLREEVVEKLRKAAEPPPPQLKRILPVPDERPRSRRGGKRSRRAKEKYGMSELQKQANRLRFGLEADGDYGLDEVQPSLGLIGTAEAGRLKLKATEAQRVRRPTEKIRKGILMDLI